MEVFAEENHVQPKSLSSDYTNSRLHLEIISAKDIR